MDLRNKHIIIETTNLCDAHCVICPREKFTQKPQSMEMGLFKKIIDDSVQYGVECMDTCGFGDPFLDKELFTRLAYVRDRLPKAQVYVSTTASRMTADKFADVCSYIDILKLSIYGATKATYEASHRGRMKYEVTMRNIRGFLDYAKDSKKPYTIGLLTVTDINRHEQDLWIETWEPLLDEVFIWEPHNWVEDRQYRIMDRTQQTTCGRPDNGPVYIHVDGTASPCCFDIHKKIVVGNMNTQTIEEVYRSPEYRALRAAHRVGKFDDYVCRNCDQTNLNPDVLLYKSNQDRHVGEITANRKEMRNA